MIPRHPCYDETDITCAACGAQTYLCGAVGRGIVRMQRVVEAARAWHAARTAADLSDVAAVARADAELTAAVEALP